MYKLHHAHSSLGDRDIPMFEFKTKQEIIDFIYKKIVLNINPIQVYLIAIEKTQNENCAILIDETPEYIYRHLISHTKTPTVFTVYLQEYSSYEEAYAVALMMKAVSPLCYEKDFTAGSKDVEITL